MSFRTARHTARSTGRRRRAKSGSAMTAENRSAAAETSKTVLNVARKLGGKGVLGFDVDSDADLARAVERRISTKAIDLLKKTGISDDEIGKLIIPRRTLTHRREKKQSLTVEESDRAVRVARVLTLAEQTFGTPEKAGKWLRQRLTALDGRPPLDLVRTEAGARIVENLLARIAWGAAA